MPGKAGGMAFRRWARKMNTRMKQDKKRKPNAATGRPRDV